MGKYANLIEFCAGSAHVSVVSVNWKAFFNDIYGLELRTRYGTDFDIAEAGGPASIAKTCMDILGSRTDPEWLQNYEELIELVIVLNAKCRQHQDEPLEGVYCEIWAVVYYYAMNCGIQAGKYDYFEQYVKI